MHTHEAYQAGCKQAIVGHVSLHGRGSSDVLSRKPHARMAVLRRSEPGRVAIDLLLGYLKSSSKVGKARISVQYDT
jgi:hypothetical protein